MLTAANDNDPTVFGRIPTTDIGLELTRDWLNMQAADGDVDMRAFAADASLLNAILADRRRPILRRAMLKVV